MILSLIPVTVAGVETSLGIQPCVQIHAIGLVIASLSLAIPLADTTEDNLSLGPFVLDPEDFEPIHVLSFGILDSLIQLVSSPSVDMIALASLDTV